MYHVYCYVYSSILIVWNKVKKKISYLTVPDPDLEIRGGGGGKRSCGALDKGEAVSKRDFSSGPFPGSATA